MSRFIRNEHGEEIEVVCTQFSHPEQRSGLVTNGKTMVFWRAYPDGEWMHFDANMHALHSEFHTLGRKWLVTRSTKVEVEGE